MRVSGVMHCGAQLRFKQCDLGHSPWRPPQTIMQGLSAVCQAEPNHTFPVQLVEQLELSG